MHMMTREPGQLRVGVAVDQRTWKCGELFVAFARNVDPHDPDDPTVFGFDRQDASLMVFNLVRRSGAAGIPIGFDVLLIRQGRRCRLPVALRHVGETDEALVWRVMQRDFRITDERHDRYADSRAPLIMSFRTESLLDHLGVWSRVRYEPKVTCQIDTPREWHPPVYSLPDNLFEPHRRTIEQVVKYDLFHRLCTVR